MKSTQVTWKLRKLFFFFLLQACISFTIFTTFSKTKYLASPVVSLEAVTTSASSKPDLIILLWTFRRPFPLNKCPKQFDSSGCFYTADHELYPSANAVVFRHRDVCSSRKQLPQGTRPPKQYWIWLNRESPSHSPNLSFMDNLINLTMSYRADSDIFVPYGQLEKQNGTVNFTIPKKTKLAAWAISNWNPYSKRVQYYEQLKKYLEVDIYGKKHLQLPGDSLLQTISTYKFYFAFENSIHEDYITEKLWSNALYSGSVPVVLGPPRANYERFIPRDAFIHVDDFSSPRELASYLLRLDKDEEKYKQYFNWRSMFQVPNTESSRTDSYCKICKALKEAPSYRTIPSIEAWFK